MPRCHVYLPAHLAARRHELPVDVTLSGLLANALEEHFAKHDKGARKRSA